MEFPHTLSHSGACPECEWMTPPLSVVRDEYFGTGTFTCRDCGSEVDLWETAAEFLRAVEDPRRGLQVLGNKQTMAQFDLEPEEIREVDLGEAGIPDDGVIFDKRFSHTGSGDGAFAAELAWPYGDSSEQSFRVYGVPAGDADSTTLVTVTATWIERGEGTEDRLYLLDAYAAVADGRLPHAIVPAHAAVELALMPLVKDSLGEIASNKAVEDNERDLTFSLTLKVLLPAVCEATSIPQMPDKLRGQLNSLRQLRNRFVHEGVTDVSQEEARRFLQASYFGYEYARFLAERLDE